MLLFLLLLFILRVFLFINNTSSPLLFSSSLLSLILHIPLPPPPHPSSIPLLLLLLLLYFFLFLFPSITHPPLPYFPPHYSLFCVFQPPPLPHIYFHSIIPSHLLPHPLLDPQINPAGQLSSFVLPPPPPSEGVPFSSCHFIGGPKMPPFLPPPPPAVRVPLAHSFSLPPPQNSGT